MISENSNISKEDEEEYVQASLTVGREGTKLIRDGMSV
jgi:hypothetical protein